MEIERKFLIDKLPEDFESYPHHKIEQGYLCTDPAIRIRRQDDKYIFTYKSGGLLAREEYNLPLNKEAYEHLKPKADGIIITKTRYKIPFGEYTIELDIFEGELSPLIAAEIEFPSIEEANDFKAPEWFGEEVTYDGRYQNSHMSRYGLPGRAD